jgi:hypothetical protein
MSKWNEMRILRGLSSEPLPCGCLAGVYETYGRVIVTIVDAKGPRCSTSSHRAGGILTGGLPERSLTETVTGNPNPGSPSHD